MMTALDAWWRPDGRMPDLLTTPRDVDRLLCLLSCQIGDVAARLAPHPTLPTAIGSGRRGPELVIGMAGDDLVGSVAFAAADGAWYVHGTSRAADAPVTYSLRRGGVGFPADALVPLNLIGGAVKGFLATGGTGRPPGLPWRPWPDGPLIAPGFCDGVSMLLTSSRAAAAQADMVVHPSTGVSND